MCVSCSQTDMCVNEAFSIVFYIQFRHEKIVQLENSNLKINKKSDEYYQFLGHCQNILLISIVSPLLLIFILLFRSLLIADISPQAQVHILYFIISLPFLQNTAVCVTDFLLLGSRRFMIRKYARFRACTMLRILSRGRHNLISTEMHQSFML